MKFKKEGHESCKKDGRVACYFFLMLTKVGLLVLGLSYKCESGFLMTFYLSLYLKEYCIVKHVFTDFLAVFHYKNLLTPLFEVWNLLSFFDPKFRSHTH